MTDDAEVEEAIERLAAWKGLLDGMSEEDAKAVFSPDVDDVSGGES